MRPVKTKGAPRGAVWHVAPLREDGRPFGAANRTGDLVAYNRTLKGPGHHDARQTRGLDKSPAVGVPLQGNNYTLQAEVSMTVARTNIADMSHSLAIPVRNERHWPTACGCRSARVGRWR